MSTDKEIKIVLFYQLQQTDSVNDLLFVIFEVGIRKIKFNYDEMQLILMFLKKSSQAIAANLQKNELDENYYRYFVKRSALEFILKRFWLSENKVLSSGIKRLESDVLNVYNKIYTEEKTTDHCLSSLRVPQAPVGVPRTHYWWFRKTRIHKTDLTFLDYVNIINKWLTTPAYRH